MEHTDQVQLVQQAQQTIANPVQNDERNIEENRVADTDENENDINLPNNDTANNDTDENENVINSQQQASQVESDSGSEAEGDYDDDDDDEGYDSSMDDRSHPDIPQPNPNLARSLDSDGWRYIAKLGPTTSFLTSFPALQEIPVQHHQTWVEAVALVLQKWSAASTEEETYLALCWFLFLPQGLLRSPYRGGRAGRKEVAKWFNCIVKGNWGAVVELWEKDKVKQTEDKERRNRRGRREFKEEELEKRKRDVVSLISSGQISRAMQRVTSHGLASMVHSSLRRRE